MIPEEVAQIASLLRDEFDFAASPEEEFDESVRLAWRIYNLREEVLLLDNKL